VKFNTAKYPQTVKCRINKELINGEAQQIIVDRGAGTGLWPIPHTNIHPQNVIYV
jgi:hypothetical protein